VVIIKHLLPVCSSHCCNCLSYSIIKLLFCVPCSIVSLTSDLLCFSSRLIRAIIWPTSGMFIWRRMEEYPWLDCLWPNVNTLLMQLLTPTTMSVERMMNRHYNQQVKSFITKLFYWVDIILRKFCNNVHWYLTETNPCKPSFDRLFITSQLGLSYIFTGHGISFFSSQDILLLEIASTFIREGQKNCSTEQSSLLKPWHPKDQ